MRIALYGKVFSPDYYLLMKDVLALLQKNGVEIMIYEPFFDEICQCVDNSIDYQLFNNCDDLKAKADALFSFGGDGTILDSVTLIRDSGIPVLGINTGNLGFLANVSHNEAIDSVKNVLCGHYDIEARSMIKINNNDIFNGMDYALNEISISRKSNGSLIVVEVYVDDVLLNTYWADGILLATPTGSTAYSMSVGGPIMTPDSDSFLITPVAAHNLSVRPIVISDKSIIKIKVGGRCDEYVLGLDSRAATVNKSLELQIQRNDFTFNMIKMRNKNFFETIRKKLLWGNDLRN